LCRDAHQPGTWFCGAGDVLYRTTDDASGWEVVGRFPGESVECVRVIAGQPGLVGCVVHQEAGSTVRVSRDCGESWAVAARTAFRVEDLAWVERDSGLVAVLATDAGLYELGLTETAVPVQVVVDPARPTQPCHAVASGRTMRGETNVAVALADAGGVHLSVEGGAPDTFRPIGLEGNDVRVLAIADAGPRSFLWAGTFAAGRDDPGAGCVARELLAGGDDPPGGWRNVSAGWNGGSCRSLAVGGDQVYAGTHRAGVVRVDLLRSDAAWQPLAVRAGLPLRDPGRFAPVYAVAAAGDGALVLAGGDDGVYRSDDGGDSYEPVSIREFRDTVTLPPTWLFCSGAHEIQVFEDAPRGS
jgi:hypothetical protein